MATSVHVRLLALGLLSVLLAPWGLAQAQVQVTSAEPASTVQGITSLDVTINGSGFDKTAAVSFFVTGTADPGGITVRRVTYKTTKKLVATIDVADGAAVDKFDIQVTLSNGRNGKGTTLFTVQRKAVDACLEATPAFVFASMGQPSPSTVNISNAAGTCQRVLLQTATTYDHYSSLRIVSTATGQEMRVITTDGLSHLLLIRAPVRPGLELLPGDVTVEPIFDPAQLGYIDVTSFDLAPDGRRLVYVTLDEDGGTSYLTRVRTLDNLDSCLPSAVGGNGCLYTVGNLLAEHVGLGYVFDNPRWSVDGASVYLNDRRGDYRNPFISRVSVAEPLASGEEPEIVLDGSALYLMELRSRAGEEVMLYKTTEESSCGTLRIVRTATCAAGACTGRVDNAATPMLVNRMATISRIDATGVTVLAEGANVTRKNTCNPTRQIVRFDQSQTGTTNQLVVDRAGLPNAP